MSELTAAIMSEGPIEIKPRAGAGGGAVEQFFVRAALAEKIKNTAALIKAATEKITPDRPPVIAYSGGADSQVLLEIAARDAGIKPILIFADTGIEYPETLPFIRAEAARYNLDLRIARPERHYTETWKRNGWPFMGKIAARLWNQNHPDAGFKLNCSECCLELKIKPARRIVKNLGARLQITGQKGKADDQARGLRSLKDGPLFFQRAHGIYILNPLTGWTDPEVAALAAERGLPRHPARDRGALTIGCVYCGGGAQFENSGIRVLRHTWPEAWRRYIADIGAGPVILAIKHRARMPEIIQALIEIDLERGGTGHWRSGLEFLADTRPWVFDFIRKTPLKGYRR